MNTRQAARWVACVGLGALAGVAIGLSLVPRSANVVDLALRLLALCSLPIPLWTLDFLTTPRDWATQRLLGQSARLAVQAGMRRAVRWTGVLLLIPAGIGAVGLVEVVPDLTQLALWLAAGIVLVQGAALAALLVGLRLLGDPTWRLTPALGGGGAFGPAESAPLLYLPAGAWVAGQVLPLAWLAVWTEHPERLTTQLWLALPCVALGVAWLAVRAQWQQAAPHVHAGLRTAELAHATRFLHNDGLMPPPTWVAVWRRPGTEFVLTAWYRTWPLAVPLAVAVPLLAGGLLPAGGLALALVAEVGVWWWQVRPLRADPAWHAVVWLGQRMDTRPLALRAALLAVAVPGLTAWVLQGVLG